MRLPVPDLPLAVGVTGVDRYSRDTHRTADAVALARVAHALLGHGGGAVLLAVLGAVMVALVHLPRGVLLGGAADELVAVLERPGVHGFLELRLTGVGGLGRGREVEDGAIVLVVVVGLVGVWLLIRVVVLQGIHEILVEAVQVRRRGLW